MNTQMKYHQAFDQLFDTVYQPHSKEQATVLKAVFLTGKNTSVLFSGQKGTGKSSLVRAIHRMLIGEGIPITITGNEELVDSQTLVSVNFVNGNMEVKPRRILNSRLRYFNEVSRCSPALQNAFLSMLSEREIHFADHVFDVSDGISVFDRNPTDSGNVLLVDALRDRIDYEVYFLPNHFCTPQSLPENFQTFGWEAMSEVWKQVSDIPLTAKAGHYARLLNLYFSSCRVERQWVGSSYGLPCSDCVHKKEICSLLRAIPGSRGYLSWIKLAKAFAFLDGSNEVSIEHLNQSMPYAYAHRLEFKPDFESSHPHAIKFLQEWTAAVLPKKIPVWEKTTELLEEANVHALTDHFNLTQDLPTEAALRNLIANLDPDECSNIVSLR